MAGKIQREQRIVALMIDIYCRKRLGLVETPPEYEELKAYACRRLERCRWQEAKPACKRCPTHCYAPAMRQKIREVMCWTGPRMLLYAPVAAIRHWI